MKNERIKIVKKITLVVISIICLMLVFSVKSEAFSLSLSASSTSVNEGDVVSVTLSADEKIVTGDFELKYDASVVEYIDDNYTNLSVKNHADKSYLKAVYVDLSGKGTNSITIKFKAKEKSTSTKFNVQNQNFTNSLGTSYNSSTVSSPSMNITIKDSSEEISEEQRPSSSSNNNSTNGGSTQTSSTSSTKNITTNTQVVSSQKNSTLPKTGIGFNVLGVTIILMIILAVVFKKKSKYWRGVGMFILAFSITIALFGNSIYAYSKTPKYGKYDSLMNVEEKVLVFCFDKEETNPSLTDLEISKLYDDVLSFKDKQNGKSWNVIDGNATNLGTGDSVVFFEESYTILLYADVNGDGKVNSSDIYPMIQHILGNSELTGVYAKAANLTTKNDNDSLIINSSDIYPIVKFILEDLTTDLVQSFPDSSDPTNYPDEPVTKEPLEVQVNYSTTDNTISPVTVTIYANKQIAGTYEGWEKSSDGKSITKRYQSNSDESVTIKDVDGLEKVVNVSVSNIVKDLIIEKISLDPEGWTNQPVTVTIFMNKQIAGTYEGWEKLSDGKSITKVYQSNKNESVTIKDADGLEKTVRVSIITIDNEAPAISDNWYTMQSVVEKGSTLNISFNKSKFTDNKSGLANVDLEIIRDSGELRGHYTRNDIFANSEEYNYKDDLILNEGDAAHITVKAYDNVGNIKTKKFDILPKNYLSTEEGNGKLLELKAQYNYEENTQIKEYSDNTITSQMSIFKSISGMDYLLTGDNLANISSWYLEKLNEINIEYESKINNAQGDSNLIANLEIEKNQKLSLLVDQKEQLEEIANNIAELSKTSDEIGDILAEYNSKYDELNNLLYLELEEQNEDA